MPTRTQRITVAIAIGFLSGLFVYAYAWREVRFVADLDQVWDAARALANGESPYVTMGPQRPRHHAFPFYYPLAAPALLWWGQSLPVFLVRALFSGISAALLAFAVTRENWNRLPLFLSGAYLGLLTVAQWTPLLAAVISFPVLGFVLAAKPNIGLAIMAASRTRRDFLIVSLSALSLTVIVSVVWPGWFHEWRSTVATATHFTPLILLPFGFVMLLALLRCNRWEARLVVALSLIPQTHGPELLLLLTPRTLRGVLLLALLSYLPYWLLVYVIPPLNVAAFPAYARNAGIVTLWTMYVPALVLILFPHYEMRRK